MNIGNFDIISNIFDHKDTTSITLTKSYRSTKEIADFCNALLINPNLSEQLNRHGSKPKLIKVDKMDLCRNIADQILSLKNKGYKHIAVICKTARDCENLYNTLPPSLYGYLPYIQPKRALSIRHCTHSLLPG